MSRITHRTTPFLMALLVSSLAAQVPPGGGVYARLTFPPLPSCTVPFPGGTTGLTVFSPYDGLGLCPQAPVDVTGLPVLSGFGPVSGWNCVLVDDRDGSVVTAPLDTSGSTTNVIEIHHFTLTGHPTTGISVSGVRRFSLGTGGVPNNFGGSAVNQMAWLPGDRILFDHLGVTGPGGPAWPVTGVGVLDFASGAVQSLPITMPVAPGNGTYIINALAVDPNGTTAYLGLIATGGTVVDRTVWSFPVPAKGAPVPPTIALTQVGPSFPNGIYQLDVDSTGLIYVATFTGGVWTLDPATGVQTQLNSHLQTNGLKVDPVTDDVVYAKTTCEPTTLYRRAPGGPEQVLGPVPNEALVGIDIRSSMLVTGSQASCSPVASYGWRTAPNPGGAPLVGNASFALTMDAGGNPLFSFLSVATAPASAPQPLPNCMQLLLAPNATVMVGRPRMFHPSYPLALPADPSLCGASLHFQSFHLDSSLVFVSSPMLSVTLQ